MQIKIIYICFLLFIFFQPNSVNASMSASTWIECKSFEKVPATLDGANVCVLNVNCLYGPVPESMASSRKWKQALVTCDKSKCNNALDCAREISFSEFEMDKAKKKVQEVRRIVNTKGEPLFPNWTPPEFAFVNPSFFDEMPKSTTKASASKQPTGQ